LAEGEQAILWPKKSTATMRNDLRLLHYQRAARSACLPMVLKGA
jgi:hypothetical protein